MGSPPLGVTVGVHVYVVETDQEAKRRLHAEGRRGYTNADDLLICIDDDGPDTAVAETLIHELLHAAWDQTSLRTGPVADHEEEVVSALSPLIFGILRHNPELVDYIAGS